MSHETEKPQSAPAGRQGGEGGHGGGAGRQVAQGDRGRTTIADGVVEKIAGLAARDVPGVHAMGGGITRTLGTVRDRVPGGASSRSSVTRGVKAEVGEVQCALDLDLVVEYGFPIADLASEVRESVIAAVERMTGLDVVEVNIAVDDVKLPEDEDEEDGGRTIR
ncbi:Asp23/Gls24 family envelope stress response protein [Streptomyces sp. NBC_01808]|uniref:Asp23/Gls24 family envelope stress response protein n=1 Tax=Streptomyces sp. NBC_01808 TaxID=2975947 RepID=UPI002DD93466|nr:Asp23/Gls24 family envelope stress response protein [Streptomyces sp. NBC_01808]WSA41121.1 Asp23/Gls24 family envelope stress response protein [Streptomyces sp. NBC_01808]